MDDFLHEEVEFEMPENVKSWKQNSKIQVQGNLAKKTIVRTLKMWDGTEKVLNKTFEKRLSMEMPMPMPMPVMLMNLQNSW
jgi:hypothetical protein